jgi:hypothetical protein
MAPPPACPNTMDQPPRPDCIAAPTSARPGMPLRAVLPPPRGPAESLTDLVLACQDAAKLAGAASAQSTWLPPRTSA